MQTIAGVQFHFGPVYTALITATLTRDPTKIEQHTLSQALDKIESSYPFSPSGVFVFLAYGLPYFARLPGGVAGPLVSGHMLRLPRRTAATHWRRRCRGPPDVSTANPQIRKKTFNVPVRIEANDVLLTMRSDSLSIIQDVQAWLLEGSGSLNGQPVPSPALNGLFSITSDRVNFVQPGLPRTLADQHGFSFARQFNPPRPRCRWASSRPAGRAVRPMAASWPAWAPPRPV